MISKRLDHVIGRHAHVRRSTLDHLQYRIQDADDGSKGSVLALVETAQAIEMAEQLVGTIYQMNDHGEVKCRPRLLA
jgi:hypothetical protein